MEKCAKVYCDQKATHSQTVFLGGLAWDLPLCAEHGAIFKEILKNEN